MIKQFFDSEEFENINYTVKTLPLGEYDYCNFTACNFSNTDLANQSFTECIFTDCDLSLCNLENTAFKDVTFINCKMLGLRFDDCNTFLLAFRFEDSILNLSSFYQLNIPKTIFKKCKLHEVDFTQSKLTQSSFLECDFYDAIFERTELSKVDFRSSFNYRLNPSENNVTGAKFSISEVRGLLAHLNIILE